MATPSSAPALLDRCHEIAQQETVLREGGGYPHRPVGYFMFDDAHSAPANRAEPPFMPLQR